MNGSISAVLRAVMLAAPAQAQVKINPTDPQPTCPCARHLHSLGELQTIRRKRSPKNCSISRCGTSISARPISASAWCIAASWTSRRRIRSPNMIGQRDLSHHRRAPRRWCSAPISSTGSGDPRRMRTVVEFNGPGNNGSDIRNGVAYEPQAR